MNKIRSLSFIIETPILYFRKRNYSKELQKTIENPKWYRKICGYCSLEKEMSQEFKISNAIPKSLGRESNLKLNFNYFLIDPRITKDLPTKYTLTNEHDAWKQFLKAIFYIGKGRNKRPFHHFYAALKIQQVLKKRNDLILEENLDKHGNHIESLNIANGFVDKKLNRILDIWSSKTGVICLHAFHNKLPIESYTREAAIIDAIGVKYLTNERRGKYYGSVKEWSFRKRKWLGITLLLKAMKIFLAEGETQLYPEDFYS